MKHSFFQKTGISLSFLCALFVITASASAATAQKTIGEWDIKMKFNDREVTSNLTITQGEDGSFAGKWKSQWGESKLTDVVFKDDKLSFTRTSKYGDREWKSTFEGTVAGNDLKGKIKSEWGEFDANGTLVTPSVFGKWEITSESRRGTRKRTLTLNEDMTGTYQMRDREVPIKDLKIDQQQITFKLDMNFGERSFTMDFKGKFDGDTIDGEFITSRGSRKATGKRVDTAAINAEDAIFQLDKIIEAAKQTGKVEDGDKAAATIEIVAENMKPADLLVKLDALQAHRKDIALPKPAKALSNSQKLDWAILTKQIRGQKDIPADKVKAHPAAEAFPGAVDANAKRVNKTVEIWTDRDGWRNKGIYAESWKKDMQSTGLYAAPGEVITVTVPDNAKTANLSVKIGAHTDKLWRLNKWRRAPEICRSFEIKDTVTKAANAFGGPIYIETPHDCTLGKFNVTIGGAVEMPWYIAGKTTVEQWKKIRNNPAPWAELQTSKVVLTLPTENIKTMDDPAELMEFWDGVMDSCADLLGKDHSRKRAERFVTDTQISAGYMHSGYPLMAGLDIVSTFIDKARIMRNGHHGVWGLFHEIGHNHQNALWVYRGTTEVTVNLFSLYVFESMCKLEPKDNIHPGVLPASRAANLKKYLDNGKKFEKWQSDPFLALYMYSMMQEDFGWGPFTKIFKEYRAASETELPKNDDDKRDQWMVRFSKMVGKDLGPFFDAWGIPTSQQAKDSISSLPKWMPADFPEVKASQN